MKLSMQQRQLHGKGFSRKTLLGTIQLDTAVEAVDELASSFEKLRSIRIGLPPSFSEAHQSTAKNTEIFRLKLG